MLGLKVIWSCGPAQLFGLIMVPYGTYMYVMETDDTKKKELWSSVKFNAACMIPVVGTFVALDLKE